MKLLSKKVGLMKKLFSFDFLLLYSFATLGISSLSACLPFLSCPQYSFIEMKIFFLLLMPF